MNPFRLILLLCIFFFSCKNISKKQSATEITGKVIAVKDGDTIEILFDGKPLTIRFAHIDCPEIRKKQPFGTAAKQFTSDHCFGQIVTIQHENKYDRYKRLIGVVMNGKGENVNKALVQAGYAWHYKPYSTDDSYDRLELTARQEKKGYGQIATLRHPGNGGRRCFQSRKTDGMYQAHITDVQLLPDYTR